MKKVIFGILSILLISPVFAQINPSWSENVAVSFYSSNSDNNITYYIFGNPRNGYDYTLTSLLYVNAPFSLDYVSPIISSLNNSDSGTVIYNYDSIFNLGDFLFSYPSGYSYRSIFGMNLNNGFVDLSRMGLYLQKNTIGNNGLLKWGSGVIDPDSFGVLSNSYIRYFYRDGLGFTNINGSGFIKNPGFAEVFSLNSSYVLTNNSKIYDYAGKNNIIKHYIIPSIYDGYSYIIYSGNEYYFRSVLPGFSNFVTGSSYILPDYLDVSDYLLFRTDGDTLNSSNDKLSVLYKTGGIVYFSNYICGNLSYTEDSQGLYKINLSSACSFLNGGYFTGSSIFGRSDGLPNIDSIFNNQGKDINTNCGVYRFRGNYLSLQFESNGSDNFLSSRSFINLNSCPASQFYTGTIQKVGFRFISDSSINLLKNFDNTALPPEPLTTGSAEFGSISKCLFDVNYYYLNSLFCNSLGVYIGADGVPVLNTSSSGSCLKIIQAFNDSGDLIDLTVSCYDAQNFLSGGFYEDSQGNIFYKCFGDTCLYTNSSQYFQSGIVSDSFYNSDSIFFSCPYPIITGSNNILSRFSNLQLGQYSIGLPIACFYSAFVYGKNYRFLSDVSLGLNPLMGEIQSINDPRNYLYGFFDFLLSFAVFVFLLKLYHLIK